MAINCPHCGIDASANVSPRLLTAATRDEIDLERCIILIQARAFAGVGAGAPMSSHIWHAADPRGYHDVMYIDDVYCDLPL